MHTVLPAPFPFQSGYSYLSLTVNTMSVSYNIVEPASIIQNAQDTAIMELTMTANQNTNIWQGIKLNLTGNCVDNDISLVKIWKDLDGDGNFTSVDSTQDASGNYPGLISNGTENFSNKTCYITLKNPQIIPSTGTVNYFVTYTLNSLATVGDTVGLQIANTGYITVDTPGLVSFQKASPYQTPNIPIVQYANNVTFQPWPWQNISTSQDVLSGVNVTQGDTNVVVLKFRMQSNVSQAVWSKLRIQRIGSGASNQPAGGTNSDVQDVKIYADTDNSGTLSAGDTLISSGTDYFPADSAGPTLDINLTVPQSLKPSWQTYFVVYDISPTAYAGDSLGVEIAAPSWFTVAAPNNVAPFPTTAPFNSQGNFVSSLAQILPINVTVQGTSIAPLVNLPGTKDVGVLQLRFVPSAHSVTISSITIQQTGSIASNPSTVGYYLGLGDGDFERIKLWQDNGSGVFSSTADVCLCSIPNKRWLQINTPLLDPNTTSYFAGGIVTLQCGAQVGTSGQIFYVSVDIGTSDLGGKPTFGHTAGLQLVSYPAMNITPITAVSAGTNAFPYNSVNTSISDLNILAVNLRTDLPGINDAVWWNSNTTVNANWNVLKVQNANVSAYKAAIGTRPTTQDASSGLGSGGWASTASPAIQVNGLALTEPVVVFLADDFLATQTAGSVSVEYPTGHPNYGQDATAGFNISGGVGYIYIDKEIISFTGKATNVLNNITRGCFGTPIQNHYKGVQVTNGAYFFQVKAETDLAGETPVTWGVLRLDLSAPAAPTSVIPATAQLGAQPATKGIYQVVWTPTPNWKSGVSLYEIQERCDTNPVWKDVDFVGGSYFSINVGDGVAHDVNGNSVADNPRPQGHFYYYRIRAQNNAGTWGPWSAESAPATTGLPTSVISSVSNFPNPVDTRKGGELAKTNIVYILNQDAEVTITLYDLLGYLVNSWTFAAGSQGGSKGANRVQWDGSNGSGMKVAKGGYIAQIKVKSDQGVVTAIRKIGIIH